MIFFVTLISRYFCLFVNIVCNCNFLAFIKEKTIFSSCDNRTKFFFYFVIALFFLFDKEENDVIFCKKKKLGNYHLACETSNNIMMTSNYHKANVTSIFFTESVREKFTCGLLLRVNIV